MHMHTDHGQRSTGMKQKKNGKKESNNNTQKYV